MNGGGKVVALSGGVGGAKLALGLAGALPADRLAVVCNTGDDFDHLGLRICPDLDTVMYTLSGLSNQQQGWGLENESWQVMAQLRAIGGQTWFNLGDRDIATHLVRTGLLRQGQSLSAVTAQLCSALGIGPKILPMSDDPVSTVVETDAGRLSFQHYFVREQCRPAVSGFAFEGIHNARPQVEFLSLLGDHNLEAVILCPSNPFVSIDPILSLPGLRDALKDCPAPVIAVSPIVGGRAIKGPSAKMMAELGIDSSCLSVAEKYRDFLDGFVLDQVDSQHLAAVRGLGLAATTADTVMKSLDIKVELARQCLAFAREIAA